MTNLEYWQQSKDQVAKKYSYLGWHQLNIHCIITANSDLIEKYHTEAALLMAQSIHNELFKVIESQLNEKDKEIYRLNERVDKIKGIIEAMHKPEYAAFFIPEGQIDGYGFVERIESGEI